jgi:Spy/CpxP family protein refolding chaperone
MTRKPFLTLAALAISSSLAFAQAPPTPAAPAAAPAPQAAPVERRTPGGPGGMGRGMEGRPGGMQGRGGPGDFHRTSSYHHEGHESFHGRPGGFHGAQGGGMMGEGFHIAPPGMWWRNPGIVQKLTLTAEQTKKMDDIFQAARIQLIDLHANVEKQNVLLEPMLSANPPDTVKTLAQIDKVAQARAELEKADAKMLLGIRGVLTPDQWTKLRAGGPGGFGRPGGGPDGAAGGQGGGSAGRGRGPRGGGDFVAPNPQP